MTAEDGQFSRWSGGFSRPLLLTRAQAAELCQVSEEILDKWSYAPGFPVIRRNGGHFVPIHRAALERCLEQFAGLSSSNHRRRWAATGGKFRTESVRNKSAHTSRSASG
jgi:hypothetical protein